MEVVKDVVTDFTSEAKVSRAGKPYTEMGMVLKDFGPVSLGFTKPATLPFKEGDTVAIEVDFKFGKYQYERQVDIDTEATLTAPKPKAPRSGGYGKGGGTPKVFPVPEDHGDMSIIHQNSLTNAIKFHEINGSKPSVEEVLDVAYAFADFSSGRHLEKLAAKED